MKYTYGGILLAICLLGVAQYAQAQTTDFKTLFENDAHQTACEKYGNKFCYSPLGIEHESDTSIIAGIREGAFAFIGDELDELTKAGYKVHDFVADVGDSSIKYEQWIYFTK